MHSSSKKVIFSFNKYSILEIKVVLEINLRERGDGREREKPKLPIIHKHFKSGKDVSHFPMMTITLVIFNIFNERIYIVKINLLQITIIYHRQLPLKKN